MQILLKNHEETMNNLIEQYQKQFKNITECIKDDSVKYQNENFKLQKDIMLLERDKLNLDKEVDQKLECIQILENQFYGVEMGEFIATDQELDYLYQKNLRDEMRSSMTSNRKTIH